MTTTTPEPEEITSVEPMGEGAEETAQPETEERGEGKRRLLLLLLLLLLLSCCCAGYFIIRYLTKPQPLPEMLPVISQNINYPPTYKFSIPLDKPVGVAVSPDGQRIYGSESIGDRLVKMFDRDGKLINTFAPPFTTKANRKPTFIAVDASGRVFVSDTYNLTISIFDADGNYIDAIIGKDVTLSKVISQKVGGGSLSAGTLSYYDIPNHRVLYRLSGKDKQEFPYPLSADWSPLGVRFDQKGNLLVTNLVGGKHEVLVFPAESLQGSLENFAPQIKEFGVEGKDPGQFSFPNSVVTDSRGNFYVSDGNNGRISLWSADMQYKNFFGMGASESALNLPRGIWMDAKNRLHVTDAVGGSVRVFDITQAEPVYLFSFGNYGSSEGFFAFPNDLCLDASGRLYIADRENNRIQVWSY
jgi:sugar lactone lactonase YvrE